MKINQCPRGLLRRRIVLAMTASAVLMLASACGSSSKTGTSPATGSSPGTITFGIETSLTGSIASWGQGQLNTIKLWEKKINAGGGLKVGTKTYKLALVSYDNRSDATQDATLTTRLITQDHVQLLFGPVSSLQAANSCPVNERYNIPSITTFAYIDSLYARGLKYCFSAQAPVSLQYAAVVSLFKAKGIKNIVIADESDALGQAFEQDFSAALHTAGLSVSHIVRFPAGTTDFSTVMAQIAAMHPDAVAVETVEGTSVLFRKQEVSFGLKPEISYFESGPLGPGQGWEAAGPSGKGAIDQAAWTPDETGYSPVSSWSAWGSNADFVKAYQAAYGSVPAWQDAVTAVACDTYARALQLAGSVNGTAVRDAILRVAGADFYGPIRYQPNGFNVGPEASSVVIQYQGGSSYPTVWPSADASAGLLFPDPQ